MFSWISTAITYLPTAISIVSLLRQMYVNEEPELKQLLLVLTQPNHPAATDAVIDSATAKLATKLKTTTL